MGWMDEYNDLLLPNVPLGKTWLIGYIVIMFHGNTITSIKGKWSAVIKDSIDAFARVVLQEDPTLSGQQVERIKKEIRRQILSPASECPNTALDLQPNALELVQFHRQGFWCAEGVSLKSGILQTQKNKDFTIILFFILDIVYADKRTWKMHGM
jgi:hypothetical protein